MNNQEILILAAIVIAAGILSGVGYYVMETRAERKRWARYADYRGGEPKSVPCPHCRKRIYSLRAIREQICIHCGKGW